MKLSLPANQNSDGNLENNLSLAESVLSGFARKKNVVVMTTLRRWWKKVTSDHLFFSGIVSTPFRPPAVNSCKIPHLYTFVYAMKWNSIQFIDFIRFIVGINHAFLKEVKNCTLWGWLFTWSEKSFYRIKVNVKKILYLTIIQWDFR